MTCRSCGSQNQTEFGGEINVHFPGLKNLDKPAVLLFPKLLVCLDCGFTEFTITKTDLRLLGAGVAASSQAEQLSGSLRDLACPTTR
jgi:hypothetical protein